MMESKQIMKFLLAMRQDMKADREILQETMKTNQDVLIKTVKEEIQAYHEEMMAMVDTCHKGMMACLGKTEADTEKTDADPGMMQSTEVHQEIPKGEAAVMPVREPRKRGRVRSLAAERRQERKERTRGNRGSRRKSAATCRKVSRRAKVAWRKRNLFRTVQTQRNCGLRKILVVTGKRTTKKGWTFGKTRRVNPKGSTVVKVSNTGRHRQLKKEKTAGRIFEKTFRLQIAKREDGSSVGSLKIRN
jgi:hypothetical protein